MTDILVVVTASIGSAVAAIVAVVVAFAAFMAYRTFHPTAITRDKRPSDVGLPWEPLRIPVLGGPVLDAWLIPTQASDCTVILTHEWGSYKASKLRHALFLHRAGFNVVLFDLRNHGSSGRDAGIWKRSERFTDDYMAVVRYVREHPRLGQGGLGAIAFSFSTYPCLYAAARRQSAVDALVLDSGPGVSTAAVTRRFMRVYGRHFVPSILRRPLLRGLVREAYVGVTDWMLGAEWPTSFGTSAPATLFIASADDQVIPLAEIQQVARSVPGSAVWAMQDVAHLQAFRARGEEYTERVVGFFRQHLSATDLEAVMAGIPRAASERIGTYDLDTAGGCG